jgi:hypothetical protein
MLWRARCLLALVVLLGVVLSGVQAGAGPRAKLRWLTSYLHHARRQGQPAAPQRSFSASPSPPPWPTLTAGQNVAPVLAALPPPWEVEVHVFAWRRTLALQRLWASLLASDPPARQVDMVVHIDGDALPAVVALVHTLRWPWGTLAIRHSSTHRGVAEVCVACPLCAPTVLLTRTDPTDSDEGVGRRPDEAPRGVVSRG